MELAAKENKMGTMGIPKLLYSVSLPIIISMIVQALYNIVDSVYVAQFDNIAGTGALTLAFPIQNLMIATSVGLAVGMNALLSRSLGQKNFEKANLIAGQGFFLTFCGYLIFLIIGLFIAKPYSIGASDGNALLAQYSTDYISVVCVCSLGVFIQVVTERLLQATGKSVLSMIVQLSGAIVNIALDPILIFGLGPIEAMGVKGAAVATVAGQCIAAVLGIVLNLVCNKDIIISLRNFIPKTRLLADMLAIGIPAILMQAIGSVMTFSMNFILIKFSEEALNVFGLYFKLQSFVFMPVFGLNNGMVPIVAYNFGAQNRERVFKTVKLAAFTAIGYMLLGFAAFQLIPDVLLGFFDASETMLVIGRKALRTISLSFIFAGFSVIASATCQALGKSVYSLLVSVGRQLVVLIPAAFLLSLSGNVDFIWFAFPIAELMSLALCVVFLISALKKAFPKNESKTQIC